MNDILTIIERIKEIDLMSMTRGETTLVIGAGLFLLMLIAVIIYLITIGGARKRVIRKVESRYE